MVREQEIIFYTDKLAKVKAIHNTKKEVDFCKWLICQGYIKYAELQLEAVLNGEDQFDESLLQQSNDYVYNLECECE